MPGQKTTNSRSRGGKIRAALSALLAATILVVIWWQLQLPDSLPNAPDAPNTNPQGASTQHAVGEHATDDPPPANSERKQVTSPASATSIDKQNEWIVQLVGMQPNVPWTGPLLITFEGRLEVRATIDDEGKFRFVPPPGARNPGMQHMRLQASDANYRIPRSDHRTDDLQRTGFMRVAVDSITILRGRVLDPEGNGIVARVRAFTWDANGPREPLRARTNTDTFGNYAIRVPPGVPLLLVADVVQNPIRSSENPFEFTSWQPPPVTEDVVYYDARIARPDLLPASQQIEVAFGAPRELPDMRLATTSMLTGRLTLATGTTLPNVRLIAEPVQGGKPSVPDNLYWSDRHRMLPRATTWTNGDGSFSMHLAPGELFRVHASSPRLWLLAGSPHIVATAPERRDIVLPGELLAIRVTENGKPVQGAWIDIGQASRQIDSDVLVTIITQATKVRARRGAQSSDWIDLPTTGRPEALTIPLETRTLARVQLRLNSKPNLLGAEFVWQPVPNGTAITLTAERVNSQTPFVLQVPPDTYTLKIRSHGGTGQYLLPSERTVEVLPAGFAATYDVSFGGKIRVDLFGAGRTRIGGTFTLRNASGRDVTPHTLAFTHTRTIRSATVGELQSSSGNELDAVLPAGTYTLTVRSPNHGDVTRNVTITAGSTTNVPIELR